MSEYCPEDFPAAPNDALKPLQAKWRGWLCVNGDFVVRGFNDPYEGIFGLAIPEGDVLSDDLVLVAAAQPLHRRIFTRGILEALHKAVPKAKAVLGIGDATGF